MTKKRVPYRVLSAINAVPWAIQPEWLQTIHQIAARNLADFDAVAVKQGMRHDGAERLQVRDGIAIVPITGPIFPRANMMTEMSGATSIDVLARDFGVAVEDPNIKSIILDIDSPGGVVAGIGEFADQVRASDKHVTAYVGALAASAAYWIASAADDIVLHETAIVGSIGVVFSSEVQETPDRDGYRQIDIISSNAPDKRPDIRTSAGIATVRETLDSLEAKFIAAVARYRGVSVETVHADFGRGGVRVGGAAVNAGMADRIGTFEGLIAGLSGNPAVQKGGLSLSAEGDNSMPDKIPPSAAGQQPGITADFIVANHPDIVEHFRAEGKTAAEADTAAAVEKAKEEGLTAERARIHAIQTSALPGHDDLVAKLIEEGAEPGAAAQQIMAAEKETGAVQLRARNDALRVTEGVAPAPSSMGDGVDVPSVDASVPIEQRAKAEWEKSSQLQAEFGTFERFFAYQKANDKGSFKVLGSRPS